MTNKPLPYLSEALPVNNLQLKLEIAAAVKKKPGFKSTPVDLINKEMKVCKLPKVKPLSNKTIAGIRTRGLVNICQKLSFVLLCGLATIGGLIMGIIQTKPREHKAEDERNNGV